MTSGHSLHSDADTSKQSLDKPPQDNSSERPKKIARVELEDPIEEDDEDEEEQNQQKESVFSEMKMNTNPRIQRYLIAIEYIGTRFSGAQQQSNARTVVGVLQVKFLTYFNKFGEFRALIMLDFLVFISWLGILVKSLVAVPSQDAFHKFIGQPVSIFCSSRTVSICLFQIVCFSLFC